jgi:hypothetical protein
MSKKLLGGYWSEADKEKWAKIGQAVRPESKRKKLIKLFKEATHEHPTGTTQSR